MKNVTWMQNPCKEMHYEISFLLVQPYLSVQHELKYFNNRHGILCLL